MKKSIAGILLSALTLAAQGAPVISTAFQTNGTANLPHTFQPLANDLINGLAATNVLGTFTQEMTGGTPVLTNGLFPSPLTRGVGTEFQFAGFATGGNGGGTSLTFTLATATVVTQIDVYGAWQDGGRDQQAYSIFYSTALAPTTFVLLTNVDFNPPDPAGMPQATRVRITDSLGALATNVKSLRFDFGNTENGYSGYAEIDVIPEPGVMGMLGVAVLGLLGRRRRR